MYQPLQNDAFIIDEGREISEVRFRQFVHRKTAQAYPMLDRTHR